MAGLTENGASNVEEGSNEINPHCVVNFRPNDNWVGEYGFDWFRENGDTNEWRIGYMMPGSNYIDIIGKYPQGNGPDDNPNNHGDIITGTEHLNNLLREYSPASPLPASGNFNYSKAYGANITPDLRAYSRPPYLTPYISLFYKSVNKGEKSLPKEMLERRGVIKSFCKTSANIKVLIDASNDIEKIEFRCDECISVRPNVIKPVDAGYTDHEITVSLKYDFDDGHKSIKAYAHYKNTNIIKFAGQLNVLRCEPKTVNIHFINVKYRLNGSGPVIRGLTTSSQTKEINNLCKFLSQANIIPIITEESFQLDDNVTDHTKFIRTFWHSQNQAFMVGAINYPFDNILNITHELSRLYLATLTGDKKADYYKSYNFFFLGKKSDDNTAGLSYGIPSNAAVIFGSPDDNILTHELLHCFGFYHSFSNLSKHTFKKFETTNIMDYSQDLMLYTLWRWQWERMRKSAYVNQIDLKDGNLRRL